MNPMTMRQYKEEMCEIGRRIWLKGFCAGNEGNHSVRIGEDRYLCTPTGISKGFLTPDDICVVDGAGNQVEKNPNGHKRTSEILVHLAIYHQRSDIKAVVHSHPPHATAFAIAGMPVPEGIHPEAEVFLGKVQTAPYAQPSTQELPDSLLPLIHSDTSTLLMGNHGSVSFSSSLMDAYYRLEILDAYCRILLLSRQLGPPTVLSQDQMVELLKIKQGFGLADERVACAADGCIQLENQPFVTSYDVRPSSASCHCEGGQVQTHTTNPGGGAPANDPFEQMVQAITDQIMAAAR